MGAQPWAPSAEHHRTGRSTIVQVYSCVCASAQQQKRAEQSCYEEQPCGGAAHSESATSQATGHTKLTVTVLGLSPGRGTVSSGLDTTIAVTQSSDGLSGSHVEGTRPLLSLRSQLPLSKVNKGLLPTRHPGSFVHLH